MLVATFVYFPIEVFKGTLTVHLVACPVAVIRTSIAPRIRTFTADFIVAKVALIGGTIIPIEDAMAMLLTPMVLSFEASFVWPCFSSVTVLSVT